MCEYYHILNIDVPAGVGAPPLNTQLQAIRMDVLTPRILLYIYNLQCYDWFAGSFMHVRLARCNRPRSQTPPPGSYMLVSQQARQH